MVAWIGVGLGAASVAAWVLLVVQARRLWRQLRPMLAPYLAMLALPAETKSAGPAWSSYEAMLADKQATPDYPAHVMPGDAIYNATTGERFLFSPADGDGA